MTFAKQFDYIIVNDNLNEAKENISTLIKNYINQ